MDAYASTAAEMKHARTIATEADRATLRRWLDAAPLGYRVTFSEPTRSDAQNDRFWPMMEDAATQATISGRKFDKFQWRSIFMQKWGVEAEILPTLDGTNWFNAGFKSSKLSVREMADLQTFIEAWAAENNVKLRVLG